MNDLNDAPEGCTPADAMVLRKANHDLAQENHRLRTERDNLYRAAKWYADGNHAAVEDWEAPDEPNWLCPPSEITGREPWTSDQPIMADRPLHTVCLDESWMVEDGGIARFVLAGGTIPDEMGDDDEAFHLPPDAKPLAPPEAVSAEGAEP